MIDSIYAKSSSNPQGSPVYFGDTFQLAPFGRVKVANPTTLFDSKLDKSNLPLLWSSGTTGGGSIAYESSEARNILSVTTTGDAVANQTKQRFNYQPGKGQSIICTGIFNAGGERLRVGYWDGTNGIFLENDNGVISWNIQKNGVVTNTYLQSAWNTDRLDGSKGDLNRSEKTLNLNNNTLLLIDLEWLGIGQIRIGFKINDELIIADERSFTNDVNTGVYMQTPNLPLRYELTSNGGAATCYQICSSVQSEGGLDNLGLSRSIDNANTIINILAGNNQPVLLTRLGSSALNSVINPIKISALATTANDPFLWSVELNPTVNNIGALTWTQLANSALEYISLTTTPALTNANLITARGTVIDSGLTSGTNRDAIAVVDNALRIGADIAGTADILSLSIIPFNNGNFTGGLTVKELL